MKAPVYFTIRLPDGSEHGVASIQFTKDGRVARIDTFRTGDGTLKDPYHTIEGDELDIVALFTYTRWRDDD